MTPRASLTLLATLPTVANAVTMTYTDEASFLAALPGPSATLHFEVPLLEPSFPAEARSAASRLNCSILSLVRSPYAACLRTTVEYGDNCDAGAFELPEPDPVLLQAIAVTVLAAFRGGRRPR